MEHGSRDSSDRVVMLAGGRFPAADELGRAIVADGARLLLGTEGGGEPAAAREDRVLPYPGRVDSIESAERRIAAARDAWGRLDALVLAIAADAAWDGAELDTDEWLFNATRSACLITRAALPELRRSGGTLLGLLGESARHPRCTAASGRWLESFVRGVVVQNAKFGVRGQVLRAGPEQPARCLELLRPHEGAARAA